MRRRICVITGSRADYGHLKPVIRAIEHHKDLEEQLIVTGQHLSHKYGSTWKNISDDKIKIDFKIPLNLKQDSLLSTAKAVGQGVGDIAEALASLQPNIAVVLGDRYEILAAAQAALLLNIPLAHIHGGETTEAAFDDAIRHAITKMARIHFCAADPYASRVKQMGEDPNHVHVVGAPGLDEINSLSYLNKEALSRKLQIKISENLFLITYHPVTLDISGSENAINALLSALEEFSNTTMVFTGVNSDPGNHFINKRIEEFVARDPHSRVLVPSLRQDIYFSAMKLSKAIIGNSSSGLIEAPAIGVPAINIGDRQKGRLRSQSVINCTENKNKIIQAIKTALQPGFQQMAALCKAEYQSSDAASKIANILENTKLGRIKIKTFQDIE